MSDFNITLFEVCELLNRSKKSISRYIRRGLLHPERVKSQQGTLEYRFSKDDIEVFKTQEALRGEQTRQDGTEGTDQTGHIPIYSSQQDKSKYTESRQDTPPEQTGHLRADRTEETGHDNPIITLLKETAGFLKEQLKVKDEQIKDLGGKIDQLIERDRETNILLRGLQDKVFMLEQAKPEPINSEPAETGQPEETGQDTAGETGQDEPDNGQEQVKAGFWKRVFNNDK